MNAAKIREGQEYALSAVARKGIPEERLHTLDARRVRVDAKGLQRFAPSAKDTWGTPDGAWKNDAVRVILLDYYSGAAMTDAEGNPLTRTFKPRDFLLPWHTFLARRNADDREAERKEKERQERARIIKEEFDAALSKLRDVEGLEEDIHYTVNEPSHIKLYPSGINIILGSVSEQVYKLLSEQQ
jgi:hypothetical protein